MPWGILETDEDHREWATIQAKTILSLPKRRVRNALPRTDDELETIVPFLELLSYSEGATTGFRKTAEGFRTAFEAIREIVPDGIPIASDLETLAEQIVDLWPRHTIDGVSFILRKGPSDAKAVSGEEPQSLPCFSQLTAHQTENLSKRLREHVRCFNDIMESRGLSNVLRLEVEEQSGRTVIKRFLPAWPEWFYSSGQQGEVQLPDFRVTKHRLGRYPTPGKPHVTRIDVMHELACAIALGFNKFLICGGRGLGKSDLVSELKARLERLGRNSWVCCHKVDPAMAQESEGKRLISAIWAEVQEASSVRRTMKRPPGRSRGDSLSSQQLRGAAFPTIAASRSQKTTNGLLEEDVTSFDELQLADRIRAGLKGFPSSSRDFRFWIILEDIDRLLEEEGTGLASLLFGDDFPRSVFVIGTIRSEPKLPAKLNPHWVYSVHFCPEAQTQCAAVAQFVTFHLKDQRPEIRRAVTRYARGNFLLAGALVESVKEVGIQEHISEDFLRSTLLRYGGELADAREEMFFPPFPPRRSVPYWEEKGDYSTPLSVESRSAEVDNLITHVYRENKQVWHFSGEPGWGKSEFFRQVAWRLLENPARYPLYLDYRDADSESRPLLDYSLFPNDHSGSLSFRACLRRLSSLWGGEIWVILDHLESCSHVQTILRGLSEFLSADSLEPRRWRFLIPSWPGAFSLNHPLLPLETPLREVASNQSEKIASFLRRTLPDRTENDLARIHRFSQGNFAMAEFARRIAPDFPEWPISIDEIEVTGDLRDCVERILLRWEERHDASRDALQMLAFAYDAVPEVTFRKWLRVLPGNKESLHFQYASLFSDIEADAHGEKCLRLFHPLITRSLQQGANKKKIHLKIVAAHRLNPELKDSTYGNRWYPFHAYEADKHAEVVAAFQQYELNGWPSEESNLRLWVPLQKNVFISALLIGDIKTAFTAAILLLSSSVPRDILLQLPASSQQHLRDLAQQPQYSRTPDLAALAVALNAIEIGDTVLCDRLVSNLLASDWDWLTTKSLPFAESLFAQVTSHHHDSLLRCFQRLASSSRRRHLVDLSLFLSLFGHFDQKAQRAILERVSTLLAAGEVWEADVTRPSNPFLPIAWEVGSRLAKASTQYLTNIGDHPVCQTDLLAQPLAAHTSISRSTFGIGSGTVRTILESYLRELLMSDILPSSRSTAIGNWVAAEGLSCRPLSFQFALLAWLCVFRCDGGVFRACRTQLSDHLNQEDPADGRSAPSLVWGNALVDAYHIVTKRIITDPDIWPLGNDGGLLREHDQVLSLIDNLPTNVEDFRYMGTPLRLSSSGSRCCEDNRPHHVPQRTSAFSRRNKSLYPIFPSLGMTIGNRLALISPASLDFNRIRSFISKRKSPGVRSSKLEILSTLLCGDKADHLEALLRFDECVFHASRSRTASRDALLVALLASRVELHVDAGPGKWLSGLISSSSVDRVSNLYPSLESMVEVLSIVRRIIPVHQCTFVSSIERQIEEKIEDYLEQREHGPSPPSSNSYDLTVTIWKWIRYRMANLSHRAWSIAVEDVRRSIRGRPDRFVWRDLLCLAFVAAKSKDARSLGEISEVFCTSVRDAYRNETKPSVVCIDTYCFLLAGRFEEARESLSALLDLILQVKDNDLKGSISVLSEIPHLWSLSRLLNEPSLYSLFHPWFGALLTPPRFTCKKETRTAIVAALLGEATRLTVKFNDNVVLGEMIDLLDSTLGRSATGALLVNEGYFDFSLVDEIPSIVLDRILDAFEEASNVSVIERLIKLLCSLIKEDDEQIGVNYSSIEFRPTEPLGQLLQMSRLRSFRERPEVGRVTKILESKMSSGGWREWPESAICSAIEILVWLGQTTLAERYLREWYSGCPSNDGLLMIASLDVKKSSKCIKSVFDRLKNESDLDLSLEWLLRDASDKILQKQLLEECVQKTYHIDKALEIWIERETQPGVLVDLGEMFLHGI